MAARQTARDMYEDLRAAGYEPAAAVVQTAIALAASGGRPAATRDSRPGPAFGVYQIRVDPAVTGSGGPRDVATLADDPRAQASAAYQISAGGRDFSAWDSYRDGSYAQYLGQAQAAAGVPSTSPAAAGPGWLPWNWGQSKDQALADARGLALTGAGVALGLALLGLGAIAAVKPGVQQSVQGAFRAAAKVVT
jgi:hypothetical protein